MDISLLFYFLIFIVALLYASVGHGGASGYLALMGIWGISQTSARPAALILNCVVSVIAFIQYYRSGYFNFKLFVSLAAASVPMAYIGGLFTLNEHLYKQILGVLLLLTALRFFIPLENTSGELRKPNMIYILSMGAIIGLISGLIGIGGGIILSPLLILFRWSDLKTSAGISALFIFVNSLSGLAALSQKGFQVSENMMFMVVLAVGGGLLGSLFGARYLNIPVLNRVLGIVLGIASLKLILL
ncbi:MAG: sulfite exporter TauE/SafE family protein [Chitinophagaceae bacterium]|nr:sulfite exporter TauE/SafE family protein [Chitinophagaceae bacterium]